MTQLGYEQIDASILGAMERPRKLYYLFLVLLGGGVLMFFLTWLYQVKTGMGVAGISHPVGWGVYIGNFVFWVGIAHSGTLISAILHLVRSRWRSAVSRASEAMTIFAVMTAGLFPLIHLGRVWVLYFIMPYPSQRQLWPNFTSPLVWDVLAVSTYFTVSLIFWYVGMWPDLAAARDRWTAAKGPDHPRSRLYSRLSLGWTGSGSQWHHYGRSYLFFAALATPLVVSVHSVVSWDFAVSLLPGWHTTIFPPYFVAGAIHSGLAMVLTLLIPLRKLLRLERIITVDHLSSVGATMIVTTLIVGYAYVVEPFMAWYSGDLFEQQFAQFRAQGWLAWATFTLPVANVLVPLALVFRKVRRSLAWLFAISLVVNFGMWLERFWIVVGSTSHDFMPHNWGQYAPTWVEWGITIGSFFFFMFWFYIFAKVLPTVAVAEVKEAQHHGSGEDEPPQGQPLAAAAAGQHGVVAVYGDATGMLEALARVRESDFQQVQTYSPVRVEAESAVMGRSPSPVKYWTLIGALAGCFGGIALSVGSADVNDLVVGGKLTPAVLVPYMIPAFEGTVLLGSLANLAGLVITTRLGRRLAPSFRPAFAVDKFGVFIACDDESRPRARQLLDSTNPQEVHVVG
jgi:molybdopterin-containing oxidoreductase family membrane subunit